MIKLYGYDATIRMDVCFDENFVADEGGLEYYMAREKG